MAHRDGSYLLVAAIDLGTTYSGYAFSFNTAPEKVICNNNWGDEYGFKVGVFLNVLKCNNLIHLVKSFSFMHLNYLVTK